MCCRYRFRSQAINAADGQRFTLQAIVLRCLFCCSAYFGGAAVAKSGILSGSPTD
ncbi:hypothetical protein DLM_1398 [Aquitalea magnusonii]|uniref:Uncharacterized protein n=1 Tax=Aquitalea magnusonii TaxID=332411 RepID=A0A3G9GFZ1_9NEIS|nr:hypothetical protein DLM_1398 [Aquitalea magnusonii]